MSRLGRFRSTESIATFTYRQREPRESTPVTLDVTLDDEIIPFGSSRRAFNGLSTPLGAQSLIWTSDRFGAVLEDGDGRFHAFRTNLPRPGIADSWSLRPRDAAALPARVAGFIVVPLITFVQRQILQIPGEPCFTRQSPSALMPDTMAGVRLMKECQAAHQAWKRWWYREVPVAWREYGEHPENVPGLPDAVASEVRQLVIRLLGLPASQVEVMSSPEELVPDRVSIDPYNVTASGQAGGDIEPLIAELGKDRPRIVLRLAVDALNRAFSPVALVETAVHEGAHYRHYSLAVDHIDTWRRSAGRKGSVDIRSNEHAQEQFLEWVRARVRQRRLTRAEMSLTVSAIGPRWGTGTHPAAQIEAWLAAYPQFPRELDDRATATLAAHPRFAQLGAGARYWRHLEEDTSPRRPIDIEEPAATLLGTLCVEAVTQFVASGPACRLEDVGRMVEEALAAAATGGLDRRQVPFLDALGNQLPARP